VFCGIFTLQSNKHHSQAKVDLVTDLVTQMYQDYDRHFAFSSFSESVTEHQVNTKCPYSSLNKPSQSVMVMRFLRLEDNNPQTEIVFRHRHVMLELQECPPLLQQVSDKSPA